MRILLGCLAACSVCFAVTPDEALAKLKAGNAKFAKGLAQNPNQSVERRLSLKTGQDPFAVVVSCSDSRVSPDLIFDQGVGDLFVIRDAGNIVGETELDSINYAILHLKVPLVMIVGHQSCGAVEAVVKGQTEDIPAIAKEIEPAAQRSAKMWGSRLENAIKENVRLGVEKLTDYPMYQKLIKSGKLKIVGGYYDFKSGKVIPVEL